MIGAAPPRQPGPRPWWERRWFLAALVLLSAVPLVYPPVPPLVDLYGHMGRFRVQLDIASSPWLDQYYDFTWAPIGNLGLDILIIPLAPLVGLEMAVKLIVLTIPPLTVAGFLWVVREVHNRVPPFALFALPFAYSHPLMFGFANFALSMAFAFLAFGLWLRLGRLDRTRLRAALFVPISIVIYFTHTFGWGALGLLAFSAEAVRQHDRGEPWLKAAFRAALHASAMALPFLFMLAWRSDTKGGMTGDWFNWEAKLQWIAMSLRDRWQWLDVASILLVLAMFAEAVRNPRLGYSRNLAFTALILLLGFILLPRILFGSAYADMRLAPYMIAVALLAIRYRDVTHRPSARLFAIAGVAFVLIRLAANTMSLAIASDRHRDLLKALDHVPMGSTVATLVGAPCGTPWAMPREDHLGGMVIVRRHGFSNDQWTLEGINLLDLQYRQAGEFASDPSQIVRAKDCQPDKMWNIDEALTRLPRDSFDYLWTIDPPRADPAMMKGFDPVWRGPGSVLYRVRP